MNFDYIENLVIRCRNNDETAKEKLTDEFKSLIYNISKKTFVDGYSTYDIQQECYKSLFKSVSMYNLEKHRFVAYATNAIKNNVNDLIRKTNFRSSTDSHDALSFNASFEEDIPSQEISIEASLCEICDYKDLKLALRNLSEEEIELINFVFYKNHTVKEYASFKDMCYSTAILKKKTILRKIFNNIPAYY